MFGQSHFSTKLLWSHVHYPGSVGATPLLVGTSSVATLTTTLPEPCQNEILSLMQMRFSLEAASEISSTGQDSEHTSVWQEIQGF